MLVITGAVAFDYIMPFSGRFADHILPEKIHVINISCVVDQIIQHYGGTGGNQAYSLGLLGMEPVLLAAAGRDFSPYDDYLKKAGVNTRYVITYDDYLTTVGFALTDKDDNQIWGFAKNAMKGAAKMHLSMIKEPIDFVLITPDDYQAVEQYTMECIKNNIPYAFDPAFDIPQLKLDILKQGVEHAKIVFGNDYEIEQLKQRCDMSHEVLTKNKIVITTMAEKGSVIEQDGQKIEISVAKPTQFNSASGAGDAYRSGFLAGYLHQLPLKTCGQMGALSSTYAIEHEGTIEHAYTKEEFCQRYLEVFKEPLSL